MSKQPAKTEITQYIAELNRIYKAGNATEHTYRPALKSLLEKITSDKGINPLVITNEPKRIACGAPDYIVTRKDIPVGYIEAKDIDTDLNSKINKTQFDRYKKSLNNLIITDYLNFQLFVNGERITTATIGKIGKTGVETDTSQFEAFTALIDMFAGYQGQGIQSSMNLSKIMAAKTRLMANIIENALNNNENTDSNSLYGQLEGFRKVLIHDIDHKEFADIYAQTIAYGMFAAKLKDLTPNPSPKEREEKVDTPLPWRGAGGEVFTRSKAAQLIPHSNPFLRKFFQYIAGYDLDERICWAVDDLADLFNYVDINSIIKEFGKTEHDPIIHFYETFLAEYDPTLRKSRGVWYTPQPVVQFIVQAVDDILKQDFRIFQGLADCSYLTPQPPLQRRGGDGEPGYFTSPKLNWINLLEKAKEGRKNSTEAENLLWQNLRNRKLGDKFRRQHPIGEFIPDFVCLEKKLVIEVDGEYHNEKEQQEYDNQRTEYLKIHGYSVIRFANDAVLHDTKNVIEQIKQRLLTSSPALLQSREESMLSPFSFGEGPGVRLHRVQILDPATGTGTFLAEIVQNIYKRFKNQQGMWQNYAHEHLIPRINGFEILMASYAMAHLKLDMLLQQTGYKYSGNERLPVFLTNSLEQAQAKAEMLFAKWLTDEANEASRIKRDVPVMVVLGNPPYNVSTQNKNDWIDGLIADYKKGLNEKKLNLDDDYIKFIRYGQNYIQKNGEGILAYISNNSFIDGVTHRQMRKSLLETFNKIYILDLHGSSKKKEMAPDGSKDENVFDIMQGVSINIFVKSKQKTRNQLAEVYHYDLYGKRNEKYSFLLNNRLQTIQWERIENKEPYYFFVPKSGKNKEEYETGFKVNEIFPIYNSGVKTDRDSLFIDVDRNALVNRMKILLSGKFDEGFKQNFRVENSSSYKLTEAIKGKRFDDSFIEPIEYRPFDRRWIYYSPDLISRPAGKVMKHVVKRENIGLISCRQQSTFDFQHIFISSILSDICSVSSQTKETAYVFPLYFYPESDKLFHKSEERKPNLNRTIVNEISQRLGLQFTEEKQTYLLDGEEGGFFAPIDILDYIYAVLHNPTYRERYKEFLKIDFPRVPYPENVEQFWNLVQLGGKLRRLHLLEDVETQEGLADYPIVGSNEIEISKFFGDKVYINDTQYFDHVPNEAWNFYIGGYQPAQKWLKDRKGRKLNYEDIVHYQKIIRVLTETIKIMNEIPPK